MVKNSINSLYTNFSNKSKHYPKTTRNKIKNYGTIIEEKKAHTLNRLKTYSNTKRSVYSSTIDNNQIKLDLLENYDKINKIFNNKNYFIDITQVNSDCQIDNSNNSKFENSELIKSENYLENSEINEFEIKEVIKNIEIIPVNDKLVIKKSIDNQNLNNNARNFKKFTPELFISLKTGLMEDYYKPGKIIGEGGFGKVYIVIHKATKIQRAMKSIKKKDLPKEDEKKLFSEMTILKKLDHPNIIKLYELFQDDEHYFLVTEYLSGGELFAKIKKSIQFSEKMAAQYMKQILRGLVYIHAHKIVHRDLKPENILFDSGQLNATLKIIDFGVARIYDKKKLMHKRIGTIHYIAPEVLNKNYNEKCDIWSAGIILYIMLCGYTPFKARSESEIIRKIKKGEYDFPENEWKNVSLDVKNLIQNMLNLDFNKRPSAREALSHYWIQKNSFHNPLNPEILQNLAEFEVKSKLNLAILTFIAAQLLDNNEKMEISKTFQSLDKNGDGLITKDELIEGFIKLYKSKEKALEKVQKIQKSLNLNHDDKIDYTRNFYLNLKEFIIYTMKKDKLLSKSKIENAFKILDVDGNGKIDKHELESIMGGTAIPAETWRVIINQCTQKNNQEISYSEFVELLLKEISNEEK